MTDTFGPPKRVLSSIYEISPTTLDELAMWLEQRGIRSPLSSMLGYGDLVRTSTSTYTTYTPTWTSAGTAPVIGDATVTARYIKIGKFVHAQMKVTFGASSTYGTSDYRFALPVAANTTNLDMPGMAWMYDSSTGAVAVGFLQYASTTTVNIAFGATYLGAYTVVGQTAPWTWAVSDRVHMNLAYEAA